MTAGKPLFSLQTQITILVCGVVALSLLVANALITTSVAGIVEEEIGENAADIARIMARSPVVVEGLTGKRDETDIRGFAAEMRKATEVEYIVIMDMNGIRKSHPNTSIIGKHFVGGDEGPVLLDSREYTSTARGTLGMSLRAFSPIFNTDGRQVGAVSVGILLDNVQKTIAQSRIIIYFATGVGFLIGIAGALALARNVKRTLFGLEPFAIAELLEVRSAMLESVREGILAIDQDTKVTMVNKEAVRILNLAGIEEDLIGKPIEERVVNTRLKEVLETGRVELDQDQDINGVIILTNRMPIKVDGQVVGAIATFRDKSEIRHLAEQLTGIRNYVETLRAQAHEFMNKLHVILGMAQMKCYDELGGYINGIAQQYQEEVGFVDRRVKDPVLAGFVLAKLSRAREMGVDLVLADASYLPKPAASCMVHELVTIMGNLMDNAIEAVSQSDAKRVDVWFDYTDGILSLEVTDTGPGISLEIQKEIFAKGYSTKADNRGLGLFLVQRSVAKLQGDMKLYSQLGQGTRFRVDLPYQTGGDGSDSGSDCGR
ncbi:DcuS/MalK family sensor histidine kinase [Acetonema longum]|uniref:histidine kinase n=1 Tax=Acetonema longum DSM 6540 TaxID=1009370 RepID=F7NK35_9FIRM|nr:DcuS/MalK family sensor histidine kinase [Acetonema longum]EGO63476.1 sensory histidine kinase DcuS [Acetonema longum DSM 6540]